MSELEKTAPNEIYLIVGDADKDCNFNELAEVTWADKPVYEETACQGPSKNVGFGSLKM